jgi:hypothetical protein
MRCKILAAHRRAIPRRTFHRLCSWCSFVAVSFGDATFQVANLNIRQLKTYATLKAPA